MKETLSAPGFSNLHGIPKVHENISISRSVVEDLKDKVKPSVDVVIEDLQGQVQPAVEAVVDDLRENVGVKMYEERKLKCISILAADMVFNFQYGWLLLSDIDIRFCKHLLFSSNNL